MKKLVIIGAGGHGRVVEDIARLNEYENIVFLDDAGVPIASGKISDYVKFDDADFIVAIGNNHIRKRIQSMLTENGCIVTTLIHPNAVIGSNVSIGRGAVVMAGVVVNTNVKIGDGVILNTCCSVDHDCMINDYCHISVGSHLAGNVIVGQLSSIGVGAAVINNIFICSKCVIGAGAVVVRNIEKVGTYVGVPAKELI